MTIRASLRSVRLAPALLAALLVGGCEEIGEDPQTPRAILYEIIVTPEGSFLADSYWLSDNNGVTWISIPATSVPQSAVPIVYRHTVSGSGGSASASGIFAPQVTEEETTVALFTGGRGPGNALASSRAAYYDEEGTLVTGLAMTAARIEHRVATLAGERVLIAGGFGPDIPSVVLNSAEIFSEATRSFTATGSMLSRRAYHSMTALPDGRVLVAGGSVPTQGTGPETGPSASSEIFDPATGTFSAGPQMNVARSGHIAVALADGRVLIVGGTASKAVEVYVPSSNTFVAVGDMTTARQQGHIAIRLPGGKVLVAGGDLGNVNATAAAELFDPATNTFTAVNTMNAPRLAHFAVLTSDGRVLIGGGRTTGGSALASTEVFDPSTNSFSPRGNLPRDSYNSAAVAVTGRRSAQ